MFWDGFESIFIIAPKMALPQVGDTNITQPKDAAG
jgi:hypothetical protein